MSVGQSIPRLDGVTKVMGTARYVGDLGSPGMLHARILRSPYPHADVTGVDTSAALALPGVVAVLHAHNVPRLIFEAPSRGATDAVCLLDTRVRHVGDEVAVVVAEDPAAAEDALQAVAVEYAERPFVVDAEAALAADAPSVRGGSNLVDDEPLVIAWGDVAAGFGAADLVLEGTYRTGSTSAIPLEARACLAAWDGRDGGLTVHKTSRGVFADRDALARLFGLDAEQVRVISPTLGASFGNKDESRVGALAALAAREVGRPVLLRTSLDEELRAGRWRHASVVHLKVGVTRNGDLTALEARAIFNTGPYSPSHHVNRRAGYSLTYLYGCANVRYEGQLAYTNSPVAGSYRSPGGVQAHFALESHMDDVARALDIDPLAFRLRNQIGPAGQPGERRSTPGGLVPSQPEEPGLPFSSYGLERCLREGAERIGWHTPKPSPCGTWRRGRGMAMTVYQTGQVPVESAMGLDADGAIWLRMGTKDVGQGSDTVLVQIAAATLGVDIKQCRAIFADTSVTPRSAMTSGSGMTFSAGLAAQQAAEQLREALVEAAARELEASPADVELRGDRLQVRGAATESISLADLAARLGDARPTQHVAVRPGSTTHIINSFAAHFAEVDIDTETGALKVVRYVAAHDSGAIVNPLLARGQVEGALAQALGFALMERLPIDPDTGAPLASNLGDFRIPTTMDLPPVEVIFVDSAEPNGPFGAKALGEVPMLAPAPALANAIKDAIGVRVHELPIQAQDILNALKKNTTQTIL